MRKAPRTPGAFSRTRAIISWATDKPKKKYMRIAVIAGPHYPIPPPKYGGTERVIQYLIKGLIELGHKPVLLAAGDSKVDCELIPICDRAIGFPQNRSRKLMGEYNRQLKKIKETTEIELQRTLGRVDIVHSHGFDLVNFQKFPNLTTIHTNFDNFPAELKHQGLYYNSISKSHQEEFPDLQLIGTIYNGGDPAEFPIITKPEEYVCFIGRFDTDKNPHLAIQLALKLGIKIKLAGKVDFFGNTYFKKEIKKYLNHPLIEYMGEIVHQEKIELVSKAKCNLHPISFPEPFGLTVMEAAYCGTPTLTRFRGSMPELIEKGRTGLLVNDFVKAERELEKCFSFDRNYIASRSRKLFNYKVMAKQYLIAYERVIKLWRLAQKETDKLRNITAKTRQELENIWTKSA